MGAEDANTSTAVQFNNSNVVKCMETFNPKNNKEITAVDSRAASWTVSSIDSVRRETAVCVLFVDKISEYRLSSNPARQSLTRGRHYCPIIRRIRESTQLPIGFVRIHIQFAELIGFIPSNVSSFTFDVRTSFATWWNVPCATSFTPTDTKQNDSIDQRGWGAFISFFFFLLGLSRVKTVRVECVLALGSGIGNPLTLLWLVLQLFAIQSDSSYQATYSLAA